MTKKKDKQTIGGIFFGKAGEVFTNVRLFLRFKKIVKIIGKERKAVEDARAKIARLYSARQAKLYGAVNGGKKSAAKASVKTKKTKASAETEKNKKADLIFFPLAEVAKNSTYSKNYINFSARQGKLKAKKIKGIWHTTEEWLAEFTQNSLAKKNKTKEKLSHDLGGNKKFVAETEEALSNLPAEKSDFSLAKKEEEIGSFPTLKAELEREMLEKQKAREDLKKNLKEAVAPRTVIFRARKSLAKNWNGAKNWVRDFGEMEGAKESAKLKKAKLKDLWKLDFAKPAAAIIALVLLMAIGNITKADLANLGDQGKKQIYFAYNSGVDAAAKVAGAVNEGAAKQIAKVKIGKEKFVKIAQDVLRRKKIIDFEKNSGLSLKGDESAKGEVAGVETIGQSASSADKPSSSEGLVLAAATTATGAAQMNIGDIEVSAYLMDGENKELPNGEYDVRFGIYTTDRTESDPYPSDTDQGTRVWEETQKVIVENGLLKTYLGATTPIPASFNFAASNYYIGIRVGEDAEMTPRKRIGAVPLARTAMNATTVNGLTVGNAANAAGNVPTSNGTLNTNLNADLLDGLHSTAFQVAGSYQPAGSYDNYLAWKLQSAATDAGQKITTNKGAIFAGGNGILTSRLLNTLTISFDPTYSPTFADITATTINATTIDLGTNTITDQNFTGDWNFNAGNLTNITALTTNTANVTTLDLGTNTITDGNMTGNWNFNGGDLTNINAITAVTGNFTTTNITTANITTIDLGTNTITDQNFTGDWNFNAGDLSGVGDILPAANLTYNIGSPALQWNNIYAGTANLTTIDLGVNTITDANMTGNWNFNAGNLTNITALTATTGNFTTLDLGVNTITDGNFNGDWNFNAGTLSNIAAATVTGNFNLTASSNLIFGSVTSLGETTSPTDSGAYMVGANDEFANSASTNVQGVLKDLDTAIASGGPGAMWTLAGGNIYPTNLANNVGIGTSTPGTAKLSVMNGNVGIGTTNPLYALDVNGDTRLKDNVYLNGSGDVSYLLQHNGSTKWLGNRGATENYSIEGSTDGGVTYIPSLVIQNSSGNVGIGTTNPLYKLDIVDALTTRGLNIANSTALSYGVYAAGTQYGVFGTDGTTSGYLGYNDQYGLYTANNAYVGGTLYISTSSLSSTALTFVGAGSISTGAATALNLEAGTTGEINIGSVSSGNVNIAAQGTGDILLAGGSGFTGCTVANATGNFTCSGNITGSSSGTVGFWTRTATNLTPATAGDDLYLPTNSLLGVGYDPATFSAGTVAAFNGNVGIGTTSPGVKLQIVGQTNTGNTGVMNITGYDSFGQSLVMQLPSTGYTGNLIALMKAAGGSGQAMGFSTHFTTDTVDSFSIMNHSGAEKLTVLDGGNVGIGTTNPLYKLEVQGTFKASTTAPVFGAYTLTIPATGTVAEGT
ncbi:MAG: hypothetical protein NT093_04115, partial [Candidatus Moranbacteria bacterium]|nr:hypothetical protein [Candidatus Moranbacteria bacterium]